MLRIALFAVVLTLLVGGTHWYLYRRLARDVFTSPQAHRRAKWIMVGMAVMLLVGQVGGRLFPSPLDQIVAWPSYIWMGLVLLSVPTLWLFDVLHLGRRFTGRETDPGRRLALARGAAAVTVLGATTAGAAGVYSARREPQLTELDVPIKDLPPELEGFRIAQLSDVHVGPTIRGDFVRALVERINALGVDLVAITGDLVDGTVSKLTDDVAPLGDLKSRHGTYFCTGNHEYYSGADDWIAELRRLGVTVLRNERVAVDHDGAQLDVLGVDDWRAKGFGGDHGFDMEKAIAGADRSTTSICLCHQPRGVHAAADADVDLVLSGHTHGGQFWHVRWVVRLVQPYVLGLHQHTDRTAIYVHPGTGYWGPPMRVGVRAEIAVLRLTRRA